MAVDLYSKIETYPFYDENSIEVMDELEQFIQQVEILLTTPEESMLGHPDFGCSLEKFLWSSSYSAYDIKEYINKKIDKYVTLYSSINFDIDVQFIKGEIYDSALIDLIIDNKRVAGFMINP